MKNFELIEVQKSRDFGQTLSAAFNFLGQNFKNLVKNLLYISAIPLLFAIIFTNYIMEEFIYQPQYISENIGLYILNLFLSMLVTMVATVFISIIPIAYIKKYMEKKSTEISVNEVWQSVKKTFFKVYFAGIGISIIVVLASLLFLIPGIYLAIAFSLVPVILVIEEIGFSEALGRSSNLISGHWWLTFGMLIVLYIILSVVSVVFHIPLYIITFISALSSVNSDFILQPDWKMKIATAFGSISYFIYSLFTLALTFHYFSLREKKEASGLFEKIENLNPENDESQIKDF